MEANYFTILYWFCHTSTWICHGCTYVPHPEPPSHLPPHTIPLGHPSAPAPSILYHASSLVWQFLTSLFFIYLFWKLGLMSVDFIGFCHWAEVHGPNMQWDQTIPKRESGAEKGLMEVHISRWVAHALKNPGATWKLSAKPFYRKGEGGGVVSCCRLLGVRSFILEVRSQLGKTLPKQMLFSILQERPKSRSSTFAL